MSGALWKEITLKLNKKKKKNMYRIQNSMWNIKYIRDLERSPADSAIFVFGIFELEIDVQMNELVLAN